MFSKNQSLASNRSQSFFAKGFSPLVCNPRLLALALVFFCSIGAYASTDYWARFSATVDASATAYGKVYIKHGNSRSPNNSSLDNATAGTDPIKQTSDKTYDVTLGAYSTDINYYPSHWTYSGGKVELGTTNITLGQGGKETTVKNLDVGVEDPNPSPTAFTAVFAPRVDPVNTALVINSQQAAAGQTPSATTDIKTLQTTSLSVSFSPEGKFTGTVVLKDGSTTEWVLTITPTDVAEDGDMATVTLTNQDGAKNVEEIMVKYIDNVQTVTFVPSQFGTYVVSHGDAFNQLIDINTNPENTTIDITDPNNFAISFSNINPIDGYRFHRFKITPPLASGSYVYDDDNNGVAQTGNIEQTTTIEAEFIPTTYAQFIILGESPTVYYNSLERALEVAKNSGRSVVAVYTSGDLASGNYLIPAGITLLVPGDDANTVSIGDVTMSDFVSNSDRSKIECKKYLTMEDNTNITVESGGAISVYAKLSKTMNWNGTPYTYGEIAMGDECHIVVKQNATISVLGYITGDPETSSVTLESGALAYEAFQLADWRGGTVTITMAGIDMGGAIFGDIVAQGNANKVFPVGQYYIQSVETKLIINSGAVEKLVTAVDMSLGEVQANAPFITSSSYSTGLFRLGADTRLIKYYDKVNDRQKYIVESTTASRSQVQLDKIELIFPDLLAGKNVEMSSAKFTLPIGHNMDITLNNVVVTCLNQLAFLPGSTLSVDENSVANIEASVYLYDKEHLFDNEQSAAYFYTASKDSPIVPVKYTPDNSEYIDGLITKSKKRLSVDFPILDATFDVNGTVNINKGGLYTTAKSAKGTSADDADYGVNITSSKGNGTVVFNVIGTQPNTHQYVQTTETYSAIPITNARLHNDEEKNPDEPYSAGASVEKKGDTYLYYATDGKWLIPQVGIVSTEDTVFTVRKPEALGKTITANVIAAGAEITDESITINSINGTGFSLTTENGKYKFAYDRNTDKLTIPVTYLPQNIHGTIVEGSISVTFTYIDPITRLTTTKDQTIALKAIENYKPMFSVAIDNVAVADKGTYSMTGVVGVTDEQYAVVITPAANNVAEILTGDNATVWTNSTLSSPFSFSYGTGNAILSGAKLTYKPTIAGEATATLQLTATYTDKNFATIDSTYTIYLSAAAVKQSNNLAFADSELTIYQGETVNGQWQNLISNGEIHFTDENGASIQDRVTIVSNSNNYSITAANNLGDQPIQFTIKATQEETDTYLGATTILQLTILPPVQWNWSVLYFGLENIADPIVVPENSGSWTLTLKSVKDENGTDYVGTLITLNGDYANGYTADVATPADVTKTYIATFAFEQRGHASKTFTSTIYADPRIVPYCVDADRVYSGVVSASSGVTFDDVNDKIVFTPTATTTASCVLDIIGVPNQLSFTPVATERAWFIETYNGSYWTPVYPWDELTLNKEMVISLAPATQRIRITYASGDTNGELQDVCVTRLEDIRANTDTVYIPIKKNGNDIQPTTQTLTLYYVNNSDLNILFSKDYITSDITTLTANSNSYTTQVITITNTGDSEDMVYMYVKDGANTLLTLPIRPFVFPQGLPIDLAQNKSERYYFLTTGESTDTWDNETMNVKWNAISKSIIFQNVGTTTDRTVTFAFEGAADFVQFHTSTNATLNEWLVEESPDGTTWAEATDSLKTHINDGKGIKQLLKYETRYVRIIYRSADIAKVLVTNLLIQGSPHLIVNPTRLNFSNDSEETKLKLLTLTAINLDTLDIVSSHPDIFKIIYDENNMDDRVGAFHAGAIRYPNALGRNKMGNIQLGISWHKSAAIDEGTITIYNARNNSVLAVIPLLGSDSYLTIDKAENTGLYTGIPGGNTYHGEVYTDYAHHPVNLSNAFATDGTALFDYMFIYGETTPAQGTNITKPIAGHNGDNTGRGSNAVTPLYVYQKATNTEGQYKGYQLVGKLDNVNVAEKDTVGDVIVKDTASVIYINVENKALRVYMTGFAPYATTGHDKLQEGVFLFRGTHGAKLDIYLEDFHVSSRNKTQHGNGFYGDKEGGAPYSDGYARGSGGVLVFENTDKQEQLQNYQPFVVSIHTIGDNMLNSNYGCFFGLSISGSIAMKAYQVSSPIHIHMHHKDHVRLTKTTLNFDDIWPTAVNANNEIIDSIRTNGFLSLKKQANNAPSIDMGNKHTTVNFNGGRVRLQNSQIGSDTYKTTLAISHRSGYFGAGDAEIQLCYGIGTDSVGGTVNFLDGTVTVEKMKVSPAYQQYYLMDPQLDANGDTIKGDDGKVLYTDFTSCLRTPQNTYVRGGSICRVRACQHVTSKGGAPKDRETGKLLGQYVYTLQDGDVVNAQTGLATLHPITGFPHNIEGLLLHQQNSGYTYGLNSVMPDANNKLYFWIPDGFGGVEAERDVILYAWKACMTEIGAGIEGVATGRIGGDTPFELNEEVKYFLYCQIDQNIHDVISAGEKVGDVVDYTYQPPFEVPSVAKNFFRGATYTRYDLLTYVSDSLQYQVVSDTTYTVTDKVYYITTATADLWKTFTAPFDVAKIYIAETYSEAELEAFEDGRRSAILQEQARHNADFAAFFAVAMAMESMDSFDQIFESYKKWAYTQDTISGLYSKEKAYKDYDLRGKQELIPYYGNNWRDANFYLNHNTGDWKLGEDEAGYPIFEPEWAMLSASDTIDGILLHKGETYSMMFPYCTNCEVSLADRGYWDYWSGKFLIFEGKSGEQTINGRDFLNDTVTNNIFTNVPAEGYVKVTGNSTFSFMDVEPASSIYVYEDLDGLNLSGEYFDMPVEKTTVLPTTAFLYGQVPANPQGMPARGIKRTGEIIYDKENTPTGNQGGNIPTVGGGNGLYVTDIVGGVNIAVAEPQQVRVMSATGSVVFSGMVQTAVDVTLPTTGVYVITGENEVHKILH